jgi:hypothetical protein
MKLTESDRHELFRSVMGGDKEDVIEAAFADKAHQDARLSEQKTNLKALKFALKCGDVLKDTKASGYDASTLEVIRALQASAKPRTRK